MTLPDLVEIKGSQSIPEIEKELAALEVRRPKGLLIPTSITESAIGGQASLIQLIATWGTRDSNATLVTHVQSSEDPNPQLLRLASRPHGFCSIWMADSVVDRLGDRDLTVLANSCTEQQFASMWR